MLALSTKDRLILGVIVVVSAALRLYRIDTPLWLDEIYGYRLAQLGLTAIIQNSWNDPHPPLYYLLQWMLGLGQCRNELCWRLIPAISGIATVAVIYVITRNITTTTIAVAISLIAATMPSLVYYSQEARSYALLTFLASITTLIIFHLYSESHQIWWMWWFIFSAIGIYTSYSYLIIAGIQTLFLGIRYYRQRQWWIATLIYTGIVITIIPFMFSSLNRASSQFSNGDQLTTWYMLQVLLVQDPLRYGWLIGHNIVPFLATSLIAVFLIGFLPKKSFQTAYLVIQTTLPIMVFEIINNFTKLRLPTKDIKQLIVLIPILLIIIAIGLHLFLQKTSKIGMIALILITGIWLSTNLQGLQHYWNNIKSPEGALVVGLRNIWQPDEPVVSLHYSVDFALGFYTNGITVYHAPRFIEQSVQYRQTRSDRIFQSNEKAWVTPDDIRVHSLFWVLYPSTSPQLLPALVQGCTIEHEEVAAARHGSFTAIKVRCPNNANP